MYGILAEPAVRKDDKINSYTVSEETTWESTLRIASAQVALPRVFCSLLLALLLHWLRPLNCSVLTKILLAILSSAFLHVCAARRFVIFWQYLGQPFFLHPQYRLCSNQFLFFIFLFQVFFIFTCPLSSGVRVQVQLLILVTSFQHNVYGYSLILALPSLGKILIVYFLIFLSQTSI